MIPGLLPKFPYIQSCLNLPHPPLIATDSHNLPPMGGRQQNNWEPQSTEVLLHFAKGKTGGRGGTSKEMPMAICVLSILTLMYLLSRNILLLGYFQLPYPRSCDPLGAAKLILRAW